MSTLFRRVYVRNKDLARVSSLVRAHVGTLARSHFELDESVAEEEIRPLRESTETEQYELAFPEPDTQTR